MRIEAEVVKARGRAWTLAATGISAALVLFVVLEGAVSATAFVGIAALVTLFSFIALLRAAPSGRAARRRVLADARGLSVDGRLVMSRQAILGARVTDQLDGRHAVIVDGRGLGPTYVVRTDSPRMAQALADTLGEAPADVATFRALPPWAHAMRGLAIVLTTSPWILFNVLHHMPSFTLLAVLALYGLIALPMLVPQRVTIGEDGVLLRWTGHRRFVPFTSVRDARATPLGVELELASGRTIEIRLSHRADADVSQRTAMLARIEDGLEAHRVLGPAEDEAILARGERPLDAWIQELRMLGAPGAGGYRALAIPRERLWAVLENPSADPSARQGAALALREHLADDERERLAAIAQKSASPRVRIAIEAVTAQAGDAADLAKLRLALAQAEEQETDAADHGVNRS